MANKAGLPNINKYSVFFLLMALFLFYSTDSLQAQDRGRYMEINANPAQRLVWSADKNTLRYEVIIEKEEGGQYRLLQREFTKLPHFEISLPPGRYRYRVIPYDLRNRPGQGSDWELLDVVFSSREQVLNVFSPNSFNLNESIEWTFYVSGEYLVPKSEIYLYHSESSRIFVPVLTEVLNDEEAWLAFTYDQLIPGIYEVYIVNPGDIEARKGYFLINRPERIAVAPPPEPPPPEPEPEPEPEPPIEPTKSELPPLPPPSRPPTSMLDIYLGAAWTPLLGLPGFDYLHSGTMIHFRLIGRSQLFLDFGLELATSWYDFFVPQEEAAQSFLTESNLLIQKQFVNQRIDLTFRTGIGFIHPINDDPEARSYPLDKRVIHGNVGISVCWQGFKHFFIESGLTYTLLFMEDKPTGFLRPLVGLGIKF